MRIKEVEARTGLTAKAIRLYESKGLLSVARQRENDYRDYTEEDVARLQTIAFLRELDISIKEIKAWADGEVPMARLLRSTAERAIDDKDTAHFRAAVAADLARQMEKEPELDWQEAMQKAQLASAFYESICQQCRKDDRDMAGHIQMTIIALCALGGTVAAILWGSPLAAVLSLIPTVGSVVWATYCWMTYARVPRRERDRSGCLPMAAAFAVLVVGAVLLGMLMGGVQGRLFVTEPGMLWITRSPWQQLIWLLVTEIVVLIITLIEEKGLPSLSRKQLGALAAANLLILYCSCMGISTYHDGAFCLRSPLNPMGTSYAVEDVVRVEAGWRGGFWSVVATTEGQFYYEVTFADGVTEDWGGYSSVEETDRYQALEELDARLMELGVEKTVSTEYREHSDPDYREIWDRILENG